MKAFLLAAGVGSRLRPITDTIPKCVLEIDGSPLLEIWLDEFDRAGVDEVLLNLITEQREHGGPATLAVFHSDRPSAGGVVELDSAGTVIAFTEKPAEPASDLVNAGIYAFQPGVLAEIGDPPQDIGYHLLPKLVGRARAVPITGYFRDIGTPDAYRLAREEWPARALT